MTDKAKHKPVIPAIFFIKNPNYKDITSLYSPKSTGLQPSNDSTDDRIQFERLKWYGGNY